MKADVSTTLVVQSAYERTFKSGSRGFFGKLIDPSSGKVYQVQAVEVGSGPKKAAKKGS